MFTLMNPTTGVLPRLDVPMSGCAGATATVPSVRDRGRGTDAAGGEFPGTHVWRPPS